MTRTAQSGFSLVELLVVVAISAIIAFEIIVVLTGQIQLTSTQNRNMINQQNLRDTLDFLKGEIMLTGAGATEPYVETAEVDQLTFIADLDHDASPDKVEYQYASSTLQRTLYSTIDGGLTWTEVGTDVLIDNLTSMSFTYFEPGNTETTVVDDITAVKIDLEIDISQDLTAFTAISEEGSWVGEKLSTQSMTGLVTIRNRLLSPPAMP